MTYICFLTVSPSEILSLQKIYRRAKQVSKHVEAIIIIMAAFKENQDTHKIQIGDETFKRF